MIFTEDMNIFQLTQDYGKNFKEFYKNIIDFKNTFLMNVETSSLEKRLKNICMAIFCKKASEIVIKFSTQMSFEMDFPKNKDFLNFISKIDKETNQISIKDCIEENICEDDNYEAIFSNFGDVDIRITEISLFLNSFAIIEKTEEN